MLSNLKALAIVLAGAFLAFHLARPICLRYMTERTFAVRRTAWLVLTVTGFLAPSFWMYAAVATVTLIACAKRDGNPLALTMWCLFAVPNAAFPIPAVVVNQLFDLTHVRLLTLLLVLPAWLTMHKRESEGFRATDGFLLAFVVLQIVLLVPYESVTATLRRTLIWTLDALIVVFAFSRLHDRQRLVDVVVSLWMACFLMAPVGLYESINSWLVYTQISNQWGAASDPYGWLMRAGHLRAQVAANHPIDYGYKMAIGLCLYLFARGSSIPERRALGRWRDPMILLLSAAGLWSSLSRGPWVTAMIGVVVFVALRPGAARQLGGVVIGAGLLFGVAYASPLRGLVLDMLPFVGSADQGTVDYRVRLAEVSWQVIQMNPVLGDPFFSRHMETLRSGPIIDIVNGYLLTALQTGLLGLALVVGFFIVSLAKGLSAAAATRSRDDELTRLGASLCAVIIASLFYIGTAGYGLMLYLVCAITVSYASVARRLLSASATSGGSARGLGSRLQRQAAL